MIKICSNDIPNMRILLQIFYLEFMNQGSKKPEA